MATITVASETLISDKTFFLNLSLGRYLLTFLVASKALHCYSEYYFRSLMKLNLLHQIIPDLTTVLCNAANRKFPENQITKVLNKLGILEIKCLKYILSLCSRNLL